MYVATMVLMLHYCVYKHMYVHMYTYVCMYTIFIHYLYACLFIFLYCSLYDAYSDEMGTIDFSRSQNGSGMASQSQVYTYIRTYVWI